MNPTDAVERKIRSFIMQTELVRKFQSALLANFNYVYLPAIHYLDFTVYKPEWSYIREKNFDISIKKNQQNIVNWAETIDANIRCYWQSSLTRLAESNKQRIDDYLNGFGSENNPKHQPHLHGKVRLNHLEMISTDIKETLKNLPVYCFTKPEDMSYWKEYSELCVPVFRDTFNAHKEVFMLIGDLKLARERRIEKKLNILGCVASKAVDAGTLLLTGG